MEKVKTISDGSLALRIADAPTRPTMTIVPPPPPSGDAGRSAPAGTPLAAPGSVSPAPASRPAVEPVRDPAGLLDELVARFPDAHGAVLATVDGFSIARSTSMTDEASHPAMLAAAVGLAHQLIAMGGGRQLRQLVVDHDRGLLLVWPIGEQRVLAVLADRTVDQRGLRTFVKAGAGVLVGSEP